MALEVARVRAFQELGPGLAVAVAAAVAVADHARARRARRSSGGRSSGRACGRGERWRPHPDAPSARRNWTARLIAHRSAARRGRARLHRRARCGRAAAAADIKLGVTTIAGLPADAQERVGGRRRRPRLRARDALADAGDRHRPRRGRGRRRPRRSAARAAAASRASRRSSGPADAPFERGQGVLTHASGGAARFLVVYRTDPYGATAIEQAGALRSHLPGLAAAAGLRDARATVAGDTVVAADTVTAVRSDLARVVLAVLAVNLILLMLFLRALIAPRAAGRVGRALGRGGARASRPGRSRRCSATTS